MTVLRSLRTTALLGAVFLLASCSHSKPVPVPRGANAPCADLAGAGFPVLTPEITAPYFLCRPGTYALEFNPVSKTALWVTEHLVGTDLNAQAARAPDFRDDPMLPADVRNTTNDFTNGYAPGHLASTDDYVADPVKMSWTYYLSTVVPQHPGSRDIWARLEQNVRAWAQAKGQLYVISGPIYNGGQAAAWIGGPPPPKGPVRARYSVPNPRDAHKGKMGVPTHLYKVIFDPATRQAVAFIIPNQAVPVAQLPYYAVSVQQVEAATHLTFLPNLPNRAQVVGTVTPTAWILH